ncbi:tetratricopeptide repeat protein [Phenylobacterium sp.]|uniref:tetratricopeptide repeat protein n=1 Tax=Phenylobacterium sp. TaxID=1871053 RepID=UPI002F94F4A7
MADLFEEVEEQLRSDRYRTLALKALPWVLGIAAAALIAWLGWWGWGKYQEQAAHKASEQYETAWTALTEGQTDRAAQLFGEVTKSPARGYKSLALMQLASLKLNASGGPEAARVAEAVKLLDQAADAAPGELIGDAARLKSALALLDTAPFKDLEGRLTPLTKEGRPYRVMAREALAFARLNSGDTAGARGDFVVISAMLDAPDSVRERAKAATSLIDSGSAKAIPSIAKQAAALPPPQPMALPPGLLPPGAQGPAQAPQQSTPQ